MFYRMVITANFSRSPDPGWYDGVIGHLAAQGININVGQPNEERTQAQLELCHHDEQPGAPCSILQAWQLPD